MQPDECRSGAREGFARTGPHWLYVRDVGAGPPIIVVHGGPDFDHEYLLPEMDLLGDAFRVVYYDQRGRGRSVSEQEPIDVTMASEIDDLDLVRESFGYKSVAVLGHSWGGLLALEYAITHPDRVSHLILMNCAPASHDDVGVLRDEWARRRSPAQSTRMNELRCDPRFQAGDIALEAEYYRIHYGTTLRNADQLDAVIRRLRSAFTPEGIVAARQIEGRLYDDTWVRDDYDLTPALSGLDIPTLVIHGDDDFVPIAMVDRIAQAIPRALMTVLPNCGHFAYLEHPERTCATIASFLTSH